MSIERRKIRFIEIVTGLMLILSVLSLMVAFLLNFDYTVPNATFAEDIDFLMDNIARQQVSAIAWIVVAAVNLLFLPAYLIMFHRFQKGMHLFSGFFILVMAFAFFNTGLREMHIAGLTAASIDQSIIENEEATRNILLNIKHIIILFKIGITAFGAFATVFTISRFRAVKFPVFGSAMAFLAGPVVIAFTWLNPGHIIMTLALAVAWTGLIIVGAKLVVQGLKERQEKTI